jgi:hypothetical protein
MTSGGRDRTVLIWNMSDYTRKATLAVNEVMEGFQLIFYWYSVRETLDMSFEWKIVLNICEEEIYDLELRFHLYMSLNCLIP